MDNTYFEKSKQFWKSANTFPIDKEAVYPEHGKAHNFDAHHGQTVWEYGCGAGSDALSWLRRGNIVYYSDIVPENVEVAKKNIEEAGFADKSEGILLTRSDRIAYAEETFDVVNCHGVLHHIRESQPVLREFFRTLKFDGMLYLMLYSELAEEFFQDKIQQFMRENDIDQYEAFCKCMDSGGPYARSYTEDQAFELLERNGFDVENVVEYFQLNSFFRTYWCRK